MYVAGWLDGSVSCLSCTIFTCTRPTEGVPVCLYLHLHPKPSATTISLLPTKSTPTPSYFPQTHFISLSLLPSLPAISSSENRLAQPFHPKSSPHHTSQSLTQLLAPIDKTAHSFHQSSLLTNSSNLFSLFSALHSALVWRRFHALVFFF